MSKISSNLDILSLALLFSIMSGSANANHIPIVIQYGEDFSAAAKTNNEAQRILDEINVQEKMQIQNNSSTILNQMMNDSTKNYTAPQSTENIQMIREHPMPVLKYAPPTMSLYAVPSNPAISLYAVPSRDIPQINGK